MLWSAFLDFFFFLLHHTACRILVPDQGWNPGPGGESPESQPLDTRELPFWKFLKSSSRGWDQLGGHPWSLCLSFSTILGVDQMPQEALTLVLGLMASRMVAQEQGCH